MGKRKRQAAPLFAGEERPQKKARQGDSEAEESPKSKILNRFASNKEKQEVFKPKTAEQKFDQRNDVHLEEIEKSHKKKKKRKRKRVALLQNSDNATAIVRAEKMEEDQPGTRLVDVEDRLWELHLQRQEEWITKKEYRKETKRILRSKDEGVSQVRVVLPTRKADSEPSEVGGSDNRNAEATPESSEAAEAGNAIAEATLKSSKVKTPKKKRNRKSRSVQVSKSDGSSESTLESSKWGLSKALGGQMLDVDPIFSPNEDYLLVAYTSHVTVYATATSLPVRKLQPPKDAPLTSFAMLSDQDHLILGLFNGSIELWDWSKGERLKHWSTEPRIQNLKSNVNSDGSISVFSTHGGKSSSSKLLSSTLTSDKSCRDINLLFTHDKQISSLNVMDDGVTIVMTSESQITFGSRSGKATAYTWRIVTCPEWISSIDIREKTTVSTNKKTRTFDIAIGGLKGAIHIYEDPLRKLLRKERQPDLEDITSRRLHWHRNVVLTVKWSKDGNYLISGGQETTLAMWQLDTGKIEKLPHLGAPIESVVVSPTGASYGIRLADNSTMILSTSEMLPSFSIAGIQMPSNHQTVPLLLTADLVNQHIENPYPPACVCSSKPGQVLLAAPPHSSARMTTPLIQNASYLQTIDIKSGHQISRQALARTNVTNLNMGPEGSMLEEPNVTHLAASHDGKWLATVDEWEPPMRDNAAFAFDGEREREEQQSRREVHLKFWSWNDRKSTWVLVSRVDKPHAFEFDRAARVIALASDPTMNGFVTFGEDKTLKAWKPVVRHRNGMEAKDASGSLTNWTCRFSVTIPTTGTAAKMAWSPDGSVIALGLQSESAIHIHLVDALDGKIERTHSGLYSGSLLALGVLDRCLIIVSDELTLWDLVNDTQHFALDLPIPDISLPKLFRYTHLALDTSSNTFAAAIPQAKGNQGSVSGLVAVFSPSNPKPLLQQKVPNPLNALLPAVGRKGFYAIDSAAEVRTLTPPQSIPTPPKAPEIEKIEDRPRGLSNIFGKGLLAKKEELIRPQLDEPDERRITLDQLRTALEPGPSKVYPPVRTMFEKVAKMLIGRAAA